MALVFGIPFVDARQQAYDDFNVPRLVFHPSVRMCIHASFHAPSWQASARALCGSSSQLIVDLQKGALLFGLPYLDARQEEPDNCNVPRVAFCPSGRMCSCASFHAPSWQASARALCESSSQRLRTCNKALPFVLHLWMQGRKSLAMATSPEFSAFHQGACALVHHIMSWQASARVLWGTSSQCLRACNE